MESTAIAGGGGGPAPFLLKTYDMVDDSSTDEIVSWSPTNNSFVVWDSPQFAAKLLPTYFKHNNFSSFIRQLNTYGFRKIDPERWEFANEEFIKGQKHLLKNIHRRKPIHSHSHPPGSAMPDPERIALEEEIDRLTREKQVLHADLWRFRQQQGGTKIQLEDLERRLLDIERRQAKMLNFLQRAVQNPKFVENLIKMASDDLAIHKKRRLPGSGPCLEVSTENSGSGLNECSNFCDRLKLGLSSAAVSDSGNLGTASTQSSNEEEGTSLLFPRKSDLFGGTDDDGDELISCHLKLTLASSSMQVDRSPNSTSTPALVIEKVDTDKEEDNERVAGKNSSNAVASNDDVAKKPQEVTLAANQGPLAPIGRVNDVFWEQFLTERPGSSDTEEASSSLRVNPSEEQQEERKPGSDDGMWRNRKDLEQLTL